jgi:hypothetical protein
VNHRRSFLKGLAAATALYATPARAAPPAGKADRWRQRRIVWNNDGSDMLQPAYAGGNWPIPVKSPEQFINNLMKYIEGTQVDTIFYCAFVNEADWEIPRKYIEALGAQSLQAGGGFCPPQQHGVLLVHPDERRSRRALCAESIVLAVKPPSKDSAASFRQASRSRTSSGELRSRYTRAPSRNLPPNRL